MSTGRRVDMGVWHWRCEPCGAMPSRAPGAGAGARLSETPLSCAASSTLCVAVCPSRCQGGHQRVWGCEPPGP